jgi:glycine/D-amino acid oxidase-like deaminating enzyme
MSSCNTADLLIVGGGVLGCFFAYHATAQGKKVILLERSSVPVGATVRNFGQIVPSGLDDTWQQYGRESLEIYRTIQSQCDISVRQQGSVYLASDDDEFTLINELDTINHRNHYRSEVWTAAQCRER